MLLGITRYIMRYLAVGMVLVSIALACILWLTQSLRFVELIVNKGLSVGTFLRLTVLLLPNFLIVILPVSLFAVVLFTYNRMALDRELVVMRAAGMNQWALARPALLLAAIATIVGYALVFFFIPQSVQGFRQLQWTIRNDVSAVLLQEGVFNQVTTGLTVFVRARNNEGELLDIVVHDERNPERPQTMMAERGALVHDPQVGAKVLMVNGNRQEVVKGTGRMSMLYFDSYAVELGTSTDTDEPRYRDPRELSMPELFRGDESLVGASEVRRYVVEAHSRLTSPFYHVTFTLIALACMLSGHFNRRGQAGRIALAVTLMVLVQAGALGFANLAAKDLRLVPLLYVNPLLPALIALGVLLHPPRRRVSRTAAA